MTIRFRFLAASVLLAAAAAGTTAACGRSAAGPEATAEPAAPRGRLTLSDQAVKNAGITVEAVRAVTRADRLTAPGLMAVDDTRTARIGALQEGLIVETLAQVGDRVRAGQLLARMHSHALHDAWAGYRKAIADERRVQKMLAFAVDAHERATRLYADKAVSLQDVERAAVERSSATEMVAMARAEVLRAIEELEHVGVAIDDEAHGAGAAVPDQAEERIPVRSPITGVVLERLVTPGSTVVVGAPLYVVSDLSTLWAVAEVDESHLGRVKVGRPVEVQVAAYPGERFSGTVGFIADTVNPATRRVTIRCTITNAEGRLKPEMFTTMTLGEGDPHSVLVVPATALQSVDGRMSVFVAGPNNQFTVRQVQTGSAVDGLVEITDGVTEGERIAVNGSFVLKAELGTAPASDN
jgi:cobalt-zinc-cadmium efflux system membrane fusion protein